MNAAAAGSATDVAREYTVVPGTMPPDPTNTLPLKPTRIARFTTDEGTWMSLAVSPDGRTVMFDLLGDVYTVPVTGGKRILGGNSMDVHPTFSPDGKRIAFVSDRSGSDQLWLAGERWTARGHNARCEARRAGKACLAAVSVGRRRTRTPSHAPPGAARISP